LLVEIKGLGCTPFSISGVKSIKLELNHSRFYFDEFMDFRKCGYTKVLLFGYHLNATLSIWIDF